ncbi:hypothetical protein ES703_60423 [subsurface metagenome]
MKRGALWPWLIAGALEARRATDTLEDIPTSSRTYKSIHHRSQKKKRILARRRG